MQSRTLVNQYEVVSPGGKAVAMAAIGAIAGIAAIALLMFLPAAIRAQPLVWAATFGLLPVVALLCCLVRRRSVTLEAGELVIRAGVHTRRVAARTRWSASAALAAAAAGAARGAQRDGAAYLQQLT